MLVRGPCIRKAVRNRSFTCVKCRAVGLSFGSPCDRHILITVAGESACTLPGPAQNHQQEDLGLLTTGRRPAGKKMQAPVFLSSEASQICFSAAEEQGCGDLGHVISEGISFS